MDDTIGAQTQRAPIVTRQIGLVLFPNDRSDETSFVVCIMSVARRSRKPPAVPTQGKMRPPNDEQSSFDELSCLRTNAQTAPK